LSGLTAVLASYGRYHRDPRNRLTHYLGVPAIIYALLIPAALYSITLSGLVVPLDRVLIAAFVVGYLCLDVWLGLSLAVALTLLAVAAEATTAIGATAALIVAGTVFVLGWALQFFGHYLEGNRPALLSNVLQMLVAPIYLAAELGFACGLRPRLRAEVDEQLARGRS
jgi:uncharacterized membrane protein YGL010W